MKKKYLALLIVIVISMMPIGCTKENSKDVVLATEKVVIDDKDIEYLHDTISKVLDIIKMFQMVGVDENNKEKIDTINAQMETIESLKALISKDVLKTMQLLGFNFKAAIGEPLTQICASAISSLGNKQSKNTGNNKRR